MVKVGFIAEGGAEKIILESKKFRDFLNENRIEVVGIFDAEGEGNFKVESKKVKSFVKILNDRKADYIIFWMDKENDPCVTFTLESIYKFDPDKQINLISVKTLESWFLADEPTLSDIFQQRVKIKNPENPAIEPFEEIKKLFIQNTGRGISKSRNRLTHKMVRSGFSVMGAAKHSKCMSAEYFINKLKNLSKENK